MNLSTLIRGKSVSYDTKKIKDAEAALLHLNMTGAVILDAALDFVDKGYKMPRGSKAARWLGMFRTDCSRYEYTFNEIARKHNNMTFFFDLRTKASSLAAVRIEALRQMYDNFLDGRIGTEYHDVLAHGYTVLNILFLHNEFCRLWRKTVGCDIIIAKTDDEEMGIAYQVGGDIQDLRATMLEKSMYNALEDIERLAGLGEDWKTEEEEKALRQLYKRIFRQWSSSEFGCTAMDFANDKNKD